jgi:hypothetical protein
LLAITLLTIAVVIEPCSSTIQLFLLARSCDCAVVCFSMAHRVNARACSPDDFAVMPLHVLPEFASGRATKTPYWNQKIVAALRRAFDARGRALSAG